jgi:hypothetical protein
VSARPYRDLAIGLPVGLAIGLVFALVIGLIPDAAFADTGWRALLFAAQVPAGLVFVVVFGFLARALGADRHRLLLAAVAGALAFDGVAIGFFPDIYGQPAESMAWVAATLLWAFAWIVIAELVVQARSIARVGVRAGHAEA